MNNTITIFEHNSLVVDETYADVKFTREHFKLLSLYLTQYPAKRYYTIYHNRIKFSHYVGAIRAGELTIEVVPKIDRHTEDVNVWQRFLLEMLFISRNIKVNTTTMADIQLRKHSVLEIYLQIFLDEAEKLFHEGLVKKYRLQTGNKNALKGRLLFSQHISKNMVHKEQFYVTHQVYDHSNIYNTVLRECLICISKLHTNEHISSQCGRLLLNFPECPHIHISEELFQTFSYDRKTERYKTAMEISQIILLNYHPDISAGNRNLMAVMFDMNRLWETYIYTMLARVSEDQHIKINSKAVCDFWHHPDEFTVQLIPDIVITHLDTNEVIVLDTKWKYSDKVAMEDVRQMYAYGHYFKAAKRYLVYPEMCTGQVINKTGSFFEYDSAEISAGEKCNLLFVNPISDRTLNKDIGNNMLKVLFP